MFQYDNKFMTHYIRDTTLAGGEVHSIPAEILKEFKSAPNPFRFTLQG